MNKHPLEFAGTSAATFLIGAAQVLGNNRVAAISCLISAFVFYAVVLYLQYRAKSRTKFVHSEDAKRKAMYRRIALTSVCLTGLVVIGAIALNDFIGKPRASAAPLPTSATLPQPAAAQTPVSGQEITATAAGDGSTAIAGGSGNTVSYGTVEKAAPKKNRKAAP